MTDTTAASPAADRDLQPGARAYLDAAATHLADLDVADRGELVSDIADALGEQPRDASFETIIVALGSPSTFAAELRTAAGLPPAPVAVAGGEDRSFMSSVLDRTDAAVQWTARELEPLWWIVRGLLAGAALFIFTMVFGLRDSGSSHSMIAGFGFVSVVISIALGIRARVKGGAAAVVPVRSHRVRGVVTIIGGTIFAIMLANMVSSNNNGEFSQAYPASYDEMSPPSGLALNGGEVRNIYAFDAQGKPLENVRLFTDNGESLNVYADAGDHARVPYGDTTADHVYNVFPIRYRIGDGPEIENPDAGWPKSPGTLHDAPEEDPYADSQPTFDGDGSSSVEPAVAAPATAVAPVKPAHPVKKKAVIAKSAAAVK